jgi:hemolysin activation/secretion protein
LQPSPTTPSLEEVLPNSSPETITVKRFEVQGSTVFSAQQLAEATQPFTNRPISFAELLQARSAVTQLYLKAGYVTSGAYIPPQTIEGGVVKIQVVEGGLEAINVTVQGRLNPNYIRDRLGLATGKPLNVNRLLEALQILQFNPLIEKISAELTAGTRLGSNILEVAVETAPSFSAQAIADNGRPPSVGSFRRGVDLSEANLLGYGDGLSGTYRNTDGSNDWEVSYTAPVNARNGTLKLDYRGVDSKVIEPPFNELDLKSDYQKYALTFRQPVLQTPSEELAIGITLDYQAESTTLLGIPFPLRGADRDGQIRFSTLRLFQQWVQRSQRDVIAANSEFNFGLPGLGATTPFDAAFNSNTPTTDFFIWRGQAQWVSLLAPDTFLIARTELQLANKPIMSLEQFALGGLGSVRGYPQNALLTDNGVFASLEFRFPILRLPKQESVLQLTPFVDLGTGWNNSQGLILDPNTLLSVGIGLQWQYSKYLSARLDWGIPLIALPFQGDTWQDKGLVFSVIVNPF